MAVLALALSSSPLSAFLPFQVAQHGAEGSSLAVAHTHTGALAHTHSVGVLAHTHSGVLAHYHCGALAGGRWSGRGVWGCSRSRSLSPISMVEAPVGGEGPGEPDQGAGILDPDPFWLA